MQIVGYSHRLSVQPEQSSRFMVSSEAPTYRAEIVRLIHGDANPKGPGVKQEPTAGSENPLLRSGRVYFEAPRAGAVFAVGSIS